VNKARKRLLVVDDSISNLTAARNFLNEHYEVYLASSASQMFEILEKIEPSLILLDVEMPKTDGYETIGKLKSEKRFAAIPVIFLTAQRDAASECKGFDLGAVDYINKPFSPPLLLKRVEHQLLIAQQQETIKCHVDNLSLMVEEGIKEITNLQTAILDIVADLVECRDPFTGGHMSRTQMYLKVLLREMAAAELYKDKMVGWNLEHVLQAALLHDVGKIAISDTILSKPAGLTDEEFEIMKSHVTIGVGAVNRIIGKTKDHALLHHALNIVGTHHEKWDGTGYPYGLKGEGIPLEGHLMALVDVYDALTSWRPYKEKFTHDKARKIIEENKGTHFDPVLVEVFLNSEAAFAQIARDGEFPEEKGWRVPTVIKPVQIGISQLDEQHKVLFGMLENVMSKETVAASKEDAKKLIDCFTNYALKHFAEEEALQKQLDYPKYEWHRNLHQIFVGELHRLREECDTEGFLSDSMQRRGSSVMSRMAHHINSADAEFGEYYQIHNPSLDTIQR
jgi:putative two-component system response regulator